MIRKIFRISFCVENCPSNCKTSCEICALAFQKDDIRIAYYRSMKRGIFYHLNCYSPSVPQYIKESEISSSLNPESRLVFDQWLKNWNSRYFPLDHSPISSDIPSKSLLSKSITRKRTFIEIFKFLPIEEINREIILTCKEFYEICWDNELWQCLLYRDFQVNEVCFDSKKKYVELFNNLCIECKKIPSEYEFNRCPYLKKTICRKCLNKKKFFLYNKTDILEIYQIDIKMLDFEFGTSTKGVKVAYKYKVKQEIYKFREKQKEKVLQMAQRLGDDHTFVQLVKDINVKELDTLDDVDFLSKRYKISIDFNSTWKFFEKIRIFIRTGKGKISESQMMKEVNKKFKR